MSTFAAALLFALTKPIVPDPEVDIIVIEEEPAGKQVSDAEARKQRRLKRQLREVEAERQAERELREAQARQEATARAQAQAQAREAQDALDRERSALSELERRHVAARDRARREADVLQATGERAAAAQTLASFGRAFEDPELLLEAAELAANTPERNVQAQAHRYANEVEAMLGRPSVRQSLDAETIKDLERRHAELEGPPTRSAPLVSSGIVPLAVGSGVAAVGMGGFGMLGGGMYLERQRQDQLRALREAGIDPNTVDLAPLDAQGRRARAMMVVGVVSGVTGVMVGGALIGVGVHRLRSAGKDRSERLTSVVVSPSGRGLHVSGRF